LTPYLRNCQDFGEPVIKDFKADKVSLSVRLTLHYRLAHIFQLSPEEVPLRLFHPDAGVAPMDYVFKTLSSVVSCNRIVFLFIK